MELRIIGTAHRSNQKTTQSERSKTFARSQDCRLCFVSHWSRIVLKTLFVGRDSVRAARFHSTRKRERTERGVYFEGRLIVNEETLGIPGSSFGVGNPRPGRGTTPPEQGNQRRHVFRLAWWPRKLGHKVLAAARTVSLIRLLFSAAASWRPPTFCKRVAVCFSTFWKRAPRRLSWSYRSGATSSECLGK